MSSKDVLAGGCKTPEMNPESILSNLNVSFKPKHPSALVTIGSVLKALVDNGILTWSGDDRLTLTAVGNSFCRAWRFKDDVNNTKELQLKLEVEV